MPRAGTLAGRKLRLEGRPGRLPDGGGAAPGAGLTLAPPRPRAQPRRSAPRCCQYSRLRAMDASATPAPTAAPGPGRKELKIVIVGDGGCGKTSLLMVYSRGSFPEVRPRRVGGWRRVGWGRGAREGPLGARDALSLHPSLGPRSLASCAPRGGCHPGAPPREFQRLAGCVGWGWGDGAGWGEGGRWGVQPDPGTPPRSLRTSPPPSPTALRPLRVREVQGQSHGGQQGGDPEPLRHRR